jgi:hypothetical protein
MENKFLRTFSKKVVITLIALAAINIPPSYAMKSDLGFEAESRIPKLMAAIMTIEDDAKITTSTETIHQQLPVIGKMKPTDLRDKELHK